MNNDIQIIFDIKKKQKNIKKQINRTIYKQCVNTIIYYAKNNKLECIYNIPLIMFGFPKYDIKLVAEYIIFKLKKNNLTNIKYFEPNILYINWENLP